MKRDHKQVFRVNNQALNPQPKKKKKKRILDEKRGGGGRERPQKKKTKKPRPKKVAVLSCVCVPTYKFLSDTYLFIYLFTEIFFCAQK